MKHLGWPLGSLFILYLLANLGNVLGLWSLSSHEKVLLVFAFLGVAIITILGSWIMEVIVKLIDLASNKQGRQ